MPKKEVRLGNIKGPPGIDAKITEATATVTPNYLDIPTVTVEITGDAGNQKLSLSFDGLRGPKGEPGTDANVPIATIGVAGKVKPDGKSIKVDTDGTISVDTVEVATNDVAGTVKPDNSTISVDSEGTISVKEVPATLLSGTVSLSNLPQGALERVVTVENESARFALTTQTVQQGDIVQQLDTKVLYAVVNEGKLSSSDGYIEFTAGTATKASESDHSLVSDKLGETTVGSVTQPVYLVDGVPTLANPYPTVATTEKEGLVKPDGDTITIDVNGVIKAKKVAVATTDEPGIVKPDGSTIKINEEGTISAAAEVPIATPEVAGKVKPDGKTVTVSEDGTLSSMSAGPMGFEVSDDGHLYVYYEEASGEPNISIDDQGHLIWEFEE